MDPCELKHNNMVPFFGSSVTQSTKGYEGLLDSYSGAGSQKIEKSSQAPMFAPQKKYELGIGYAFDYRLYAGENEK